MSKCKTCGEAFRKGKRRVVLHFDGSISTAIVCAACVGRSVSIVTPFPRAGLTVQGVGLLQRVSDRLWTLLTAASMTALPTNADSCGACGRLTSGQEDFVRGRIDALTSAVELIQRAIAGVDP
jgi:hypothetical protein